jgi:dolichyl-phosphooligosaccharide-protein glycotransferase
MNNKSGFPNISRPAIVTGIALLILCGISLYIRIAYQYEQIFVDGAVWFKGVDAWYHMRLVDNLLQHFPHRIFFDPYTFYPNGDHLGWPPFFDLIIAATVRFIGGANPSQHTVDVIAAYIPPVMGTLTILPVYFIGKELFSRWAGLFAAALLVVLPGEFLNRSLLGFTDHHVAESLFSTTTILFLILAIKNARERKLSFRHIMDRDWKVLAKPFIYTLLAGVFLAIYLLSWVGGLMFVFILFAWIVIQFIIDHLGGKSTDYLCITGTATFGVAAILYLPILPSTWISSMQYASLTIAIATPLLLGVISQLMNRKGLNPVYFPLALLGLAAIGLAAFHIIEPSLLKSMINQFGIFTPRGRSMTIEEAHPLFFSLKGFTGLIAWLNFTTSFYLSVLVIGWLIYLSIKNRQFEWTLFLVWSIVMLAAVLGKRRFSYYYAVNAALLTGYLCWRLLEQAGLAKLVVIKEHAVRTARKAKKGGVTRIKRSFLQPRDAWFDVMLAGIGIFFLVFFPNTGLPGIKAGTPVLGIPIKTTELLASSSNNIDRAWYDSLMWLKDNSPEPFGYADSYYELYEAPAKGEKYAYPESAYSIMAWWDYGHWINRIAHRIAISNPFQAGADKVARFFVTQHEDEASKILDKLDAKYIIVDYKITANQFYAVPTWAGKNYDNFYQPYYFSQEDGALKGELFYYPAYYQSAVVRLYNFNGKAAVPDNSTVILSYREITGIEGTTYREVLDSMTFSSYKEAQDYVLQQESGKYVLGNFDPFVTPVPLEEMEYIELVHESAQQHNGKAEVKIFEYTKSE